MTIHRAQRPIDSSSAGRGVCIWLTGLSGAGKSTTAKAVAELFAANGTRFTLLDGDDIRRRLCADLGFSKADRDTQVLRVATLAHDHVEKGEIVLCALISPYRETRAQARAIIGSHRFIEVFVDTPLSVCEARDVKGLYGQARSGRIASFTGIDDPYEPPSSPELVLRTTDTSAVDNARRIAALLHDRLWPHTVVADASALE